MGLPLYFMKRQEPALDSGGSVVLKSLWFLVIVEPVITYTPVGEESGIGVPSYSRRRVGNRSSLLQG